MDHETSSVEVESQTSASNPLDDVPPLRLGIGHILIFTACVAIQFARGEYAARPFAFDQLFDFAVIALESLAMTVALVLIVRWIRRIVRPVQPGEWLLLAEGSAIWLRLIIHPGGDLVLLPIGVMPWWLLLVDWIYGGLLLTGAFLLYRRRDWAWGMCLAGWAIWCMTQPAVQRIYYHFYVNPDHFREAPTWLIMGGMVLMIPSAVVAVIALVVAVIGDLLRKRRRGLVHRLSLISMGVYLAITVTYYFLYSFLLVG